MCSVCLWVNGSLSVHMGVVLAVILTTSWRGLPARTFFRVVKDVLEICATQQLWFFQAFCCPCNLLHQYRPLAMASHCKWAIPATHSSYSIGSRNKFALVQLEHAIMMMTMKFSWRLQESSETACFSACLRCNFKSEVRTFHSMKFYVVTASEVVYSAAPSSCSEWSQAGASMRSDAMRECLRQSRHELVPPEWCKLSDCTGKLDSEVTYQPDQQVLSYKCCQQAFNECHNVLLLQGGLLTDGMCWVQMCSELLEGRTAVEGLARPHRRSMILNYYSSVHYYY